MKKDLMTVIKDSRTGIEYGVVNLALKIHDSELVTVDSSKYVHHKTENNTEMLANVTQILKSSVIAKETGQITFTVEMVNGNSKRITVSDIKRTSMKEDK